MAKKKSLGINAILNIIRTVLALVAPLITYPYVSRILGADNLGSVNTTNSIVQYFILFSGLGISTYGIREGAKRRDDPQKVSQFISECFTINIIFTVISYLAFFVLLFFYRNDESYFYLFVIQSFLIIFNTVGIDWVNTVYEDYLFITVRTIVVQLISIALTFLLIHSKDDYFLYAVVTTVTTGTVSVLNWFHYRKNVSIRIVRHPNFREHIKPILVFFANKLAVTLYVSADTTMLGTMVSDHSVGIYSVAVKIYTIVKNLLAAIYSVFIPRLSYTLGQDDKKSFRTIYSDLISIMTLLIFPAAVGLMLLSKNVILMFFGDEYKEAWLSLAILSVAIIFAIYGGLVSAVFDVVMGLEKIALQATIISAIVNVGLNVVVLPAFEQNGAAATTLIAEAVTFLYCLIRSKQIRQYVEKKNVLKNLLQSLLGCAEVGLIVYLVEKFLTSDILICLLSCVLSLLVYFVTLVIFKNQYILSGIDYIVKKLKKSQ